MSSTTEAPKRPPTSAVKPKAPSFMKPTSSTLNKPPARPTSSTATLKTPAKGATTPGSAHRKNASITSTEEAIESSAFGDERKRSSIAKPAKRMSLAGSTLPGQTNVKPASEMHDRRSTMQPSPAKERKPIGRATTLSPTKATKPPTTPSTRTPIGGVSRLSRPLTSSLRSTGVSEGKKRLSTIPASPAVKIEADTSGHDKENAKPDGLSKSIPKRPTLGTRQSTRSVVMERQIREFELVHEMLQIAAAAEDAGDQARLSMAEDQVAEKMDKLRENLGKIRAFEKKHGRKPTESELEDGIDVKVEEDDKTNALVDTERGLATVDAASANEANEEISELKTQLSERQAQVESLLAELASMRSWLKESGDSSDGEVDQPGSSKKAIRREHAAKVDDLVTSHEEEVAVLRSQIAEAERREKALWEQARADLKASEAAAAVAGDSKMAQMLQQQEQQHVQAITEVREQLEQHKGLAADADRKYKMELDALREGAEAQDQDTAEHEQKMATLEEELTGKLSTIRSFQTELAELKEKKEQTANELKAALDSGASGKAAQQEIIDSLKKDLETSKKDHEAELESVHSQVEDRHKDLLDAQIKIAAFEQKSSHESTAVKRLQDELDAVEQSKKQLASELEATRQSGAVVVAAAKEEADVLRRELEVVRSNIKTSLEEEQLALQKKDDEIAGLSEVVEKLQDELRKVHQTKSDEKDAEVLRLGKDHEVLQKRMTDTNQQHRTQLSQKEQEHAEVVSAMTDQHLKALSAMSQTHNQDVDAAMASTERNHKKALSEMSQKHNDHLEAAMASMKKDQKVQLEATLNESLNSARSEHEQRVAALEAAVAKAKEDSEILAAKLRTEAEASQKTAQQNIDAFEEELAARKSQAGQDGSALKTAQDDLEASRNQVTSLQQMLESLMQESNTKAGHHAEEIQKAKAAAEEAAQALSEHSREIESARKGHHDALQSIQTDHEAEIESLRSEIALQNETAVSQLQAQHDEALNSIKNEMNTAHARKMEELETQLESKHTSQVGDAATMVTELHEKHEAEMARALDDARNATQEQLRAQLEEHEAKLAKAVEEVRTSTKAEVHLDLDQQHEAARLTALAELRSELESQHNSDLGKARSAAERGHQKELLTLTAAAQAADKAIKQTNKETDSLRKDLQAALDRAKAAELRADQHGESGKAELVMLKDQLDGALLEAETQRQIADQRAKDLEALKNSQQKIADKISEEVEALKKKHEMALDSSKTKIMELESSLKVTKAELTEAKTERAAGVDFLKSPTGKTDSSPTSKWAEAQPFTPSKKAGAGGEPGGDRSHITHGKLAGLVEDSRQLKEISNDFQEDHER